MDVLYFKNQYLSIPSYYNKDSIDKPSWLGKAKYSMKFKNKEVGYIQIKHYYNPATKIFQFKAILSILCF